ncbi:MAG: DNA repair protein RadC [Candidatus ainarchaeum sp.]|nr:DNA repair protein RadC [Candidatus ainarchaeum sp.]
MKIKEIFIGERPRERMLKYGGENLSASELLAIILRVGNKNENVIEMSQRIISTFSLSNLSELSIQELCSIKGIGVSKALSIKAIFEINKRVNMEKKKIIKITNAKDVFDLMNPLISTKKQEHFYVLHLNSKNEIISYNLIAIGTLNSVLIHPREVFKIAIKESAQGIILVHNHPSGDPNPSLADKEITSKIEKASELIGIALLDHIIIGKEKWFSFDDEIS